MRAFPSFWQFVQHPSTVDFRAKIHHGILRSLGEEDQAMESAMFVMIGALFLSIASANAQTVRSPQLVPLPAPHHISLSNLLMVSGPFLTFLNYLPSTKVNDTFQSQADKSEQGITIFVPRSSAFSSLKEPSLSKLAQDQLRSLLLFHALPHYYSLSQLKNLSRLGIVSTFAGGPYTMNFSDVLGNPQIDPGWASTDIVRIVYSIAPVAVYEVDRVLIPLALLSPPPPPAPTPAHGPRAATSADSAAAASGPTQDGSSSMTQSSSPSSYKIGFGVLVIWAWQFQAT